MVDPGEEALDQPAPCMDGEADLAFMAAHDLDPDWAGRGNPGSLVARIGERLCLICRVGPTAEPVPDDIAALRAALAFERSARREAEARASCAEAMVARLQLPRRAREGDGLHVQALGLLNRVPRRRSDLPDQQRRRTGIAPCRPRQEVIAVRRSDRGGHRGATMYSLIVTAKLNDVDPRA